MNLLKLSEVAVNLAQTSRVLTSAGYHIVSRTAADAANSTLELVSRELQDMEDEKPSTEPTHHIELQPGYEWLKGMLLENITFENAADTKPSGYYLVGTADGSAGFLFWDATRDQWLSSRGVLGKPLVYYCPESYIDREWRSMSSL